MFSAIPSLPWWYFTGESVGYTRGYKAVDCALKTVTVVSVSNTTRTVTVQTLNSKWIITRIFKSLKDFIYIYDVIQRKAWVLQWLENGVRTPFPEYAPPFEFGNQLGVTDR